MLNKDTVTVLNDLIQTSGDGEKGFAEAEKEATTTELKTVFRKRAADCSSAIVELQALIGSIGGIPKDSGTVAGAMHRGWAKVKATVGDPNVGMLEEVERAEDKAKAVYAKALTAALPTQVRAVIERQHAGAVRNHDQIRDLRNNYKAAMHAAAT